MRLRQQPAHVWYRGFIYKNHAQTIVIRWGMRTTVAACFFICPYEIILRPLSWGEDNSRCMFLYMAISNHAQTIAMILRQQPPHVWYRGYVKPCSDRSHEVRTTTAAFFLYGHIKICSDHWHEMRTTAVACLSIRPYFTMLRLVS